MCLSLRVLQGLGTCFQVPELLREALLLKATPMASGSQVTMGWAVNPGLS